MTTNTATDNRQPQTPFGSHESYSPEAVELMRVLGRKRRQTGQRTSSPEQILEAVSELGYCQPEDQHLAEAPEAARFVQAMTAYQQRNEVAYPRCEDLLNVLQNLKYFRSTECVPAAVEGLPIDRRRNEEDERRDKCDRRSSSAPGPQEQMELTSDEHALLDALKELRLRTGREFASSEELLSILWEQGYRPVGKDNQPVQWLEHDDRCQLQMAFTQTVERRMNDGEFLTCRSLLEIVAELGFRK